MLGKIKSIDFNDLIGLALFILPFSTKLNVYAIILMLIYWIFFEKKFIPIEKTRITNILAFSAFYLVCVLAILWTCDMGNGLFILEKRFSLLLFPVLIFLSKSKVNLDKIFKYLLFSTFISFIYSFCYAYHQYYITGDQWTPFRYFNFTVNSIGIHPGYLSMYLIVTLIFTMEKAFRSELKKSKIKWILISLLCSLFILYIGAKSSFFILILVLFLNVIRFIKNIKDVLKYFLILGLVLVVVSYAYYSFSYGFRTRIIFLLNGRYNNIQERLDIYSSILLLIERNPVKIFFGLGTGCLISNLVEVYREMNFLILMEKKMDAHSIYLKSLAEQGLLGLTTTIMLFRGLNIRFYKVNFKYFLFSISFFLFGTIEHFLDTQHGIVFFSIINILFYKSELDKNEFRSI